MGLRVIFGAVQASRDSQRCLEWLHSLGTQMSLPVPSASGWGQRDWGAPAPARGVPVLPPSKQTGQIYCDSFDTWMLCAALGCLGLLWGAGETSQSPVEPVGGGDLPQLSPTASVTKNTGGTPTDFWLPPHGTSHPSFSEFSCTFPAPFLHTHIHCMSLPHSLQRSCTILAHFFHAAPTLLAPCSFHASFPTLTPTLHAAAATLLPRPLHTPCSRAGSFAPAPPHPTPLSGHRYGVRAPSFRINLGFIMPAGRRN